VAGTASKLIVTKPAASNLDKQFMVANGYGFNKFGKGLLLNAEGDRRSVSN
jgi:hypothetical protein